MPLAKACLIVHGTQASNEGRNICKGSNPPGLTVLSIAVRLPPPMANLRSKLSNVYTTAVMTEKNPPLYFDSDQISFGCFKANPAMNL